MTNLLLVSFHALRLIASPEAVREECTLEERSVSCENLAAPADLATLEQALEGEWGKPLTTDELTHLKEIVLASYGEEGAQVVFAEIPPQNIESGTLQMVVRKARVGKISSEGARYFPWIPSRISAKPGEQIQLSDLAFDLHALNRNPFRRTDLIFTPVRGEGIADIELKTEELFPFRVYAGGDNTGVLPSGNNRWYGGFNWGKAFGCDQILSYQFTTADNYSNFWAHSLDYTILLPWRHALDIYGGYSEVKSALLNRPDLFTHGKSAQGSFRYEIPLPPAISILEEFSFGADWKLTNTNLFSGEVFFSGPTAQLFQVALGLRAGFETAMSKSWLALEIFNSPGQWLPDQSNADYNALRAGAKNTYTYGRATGGVRLELPHRFTLEALARGQVSSANLLSSEQFGVGGYNTVRGYEEREANGDNAFVGNLELKFPGFSVLRLDPGKKGTGGDTLRLLAFIDAGYTNNHKAQLGEPKSQYLLGVGPGLRYIIPGHVTLRADYGFKLHPLTLDTSLRKHKLHFGFTASY